MMRRDWTGSSLAERAAYALEFAQPTLLAHKKVRSGEVRPFQGKIGPRGLEALHGLSAPQVSRLLKGDREIKADAAKAYAIATGVSYVWLTLGEGQPDDPNMWGVGYCHELELAIAFHQSNYGEQVLQKARAMAMTSDRKSPQVWAGVLRDLQSQALNAHEEPTDATRESAVKVSGARHKIQKVGKRKRA